MPLGWRCFAGTSVFWACWRLAPAAGAGAGLAHATGMQRAAEQRIGARNGDATASRVHATHGVSHRAAEARRDALRDAAIE